MSEQAHPGFNQPPAADADSAVTIKASELQRYRSMEAEVERLKALEPQLQDLRSKYDADLADRDGRLTTLNGELEAIRKSAGDERAQWEAKLADTTKALEAKLAEASSQVAPYRQRLMDQAKMEAIHAATAGVDWVGDASTRPEVAGAFRSLVAPRLDTIEDADGNISVVERSTGRPAAEAIKGMLNEPRYLGFFAPKTRGGSGTDGAGSTSSTVHPSGNPHPPNSVEWHGWNMARAREANGSGLLIRERS